MTLNKPMQRFLEQVASDGGVADHIREGALRMLDEAKRHRRTVLAKSRPRRQTEAELEQLERERHARLVQTVLDRDHGRCQLCDEVHGVHDLVDAHHLELGSGKTKKERLDNLITAHRSCHDAYHLNAKAFVARVKAWCERNGYRLPRRKEYRDA